MAHFAATFPRQLRGFVQLLSICGDYVQNSVAQLKDLASRPITAKVLDQAKKDSGQRFPLKDLLNVPMQRILKYPLLLKVALSNATCFFVCVFQLLIVTGTDQAHA